MISSWHQLLAATLCVLLSFPGSSLPSENTTSFAGSYDFENHLVQAGGGISMVYDGDGNRVSKTVAGVTTTYLVDPQSPTGYPQVISESLSGGTAPNRELSHTFVYGLERVSEGRANLINGNQVVKSTIYFDYDGHGSVRALTDPNGNVTDTYDYDAFGNLLHSTGSTPNNYLFASEQFDPDLALYYNRARYLNVSTGRFWITDTKEGHLAGPLSLHRYLYVSDDPVNRIDPSGNDGTLAETIGTLPTSYVIASLTVLSIAGACAAVAVLTRHGVGPCTTGPPEILYHYTAVNSLEGIAGSAVLLASPSGAYGAGQYFTDIRPFEAESHTKQDLSFALYAFPDRWADTDVGFIGVDLQGLDVVREADVYGEVFTGKGIFLNGTTAQLPLVFRLQSLGVLVFAQDLGAGQ